MAGFLTIADFVSTGVMMIMIYISMNARSVVISCEWRLSVVLHS